MNIFSPYRGGESGYILCQIIRTYKYCFRLEHIAVDPYMFGKGNPEGIDTGAFWFYFKFGFRHVDKQLNKMANVEFKKIKANKLYRTPRKTLIEFATGDIEISWTNERHIKRAQILENVEAIIKAKHQGNYNKALDASRLLFKNKRLMAYAAFAEWALFASAFHCKRKQLEELSKIISEKQKNVYRYNTKLIHFLKSIS
ncbi:MAG: hypothetical protein IPO27_02340 [Bacteroidetes bacterium]|nr:hypothetical protein [Bacteroidota bacterium]